MALLQITPLQNGQFFDDAVDAAKLLQDLVVYFVTGFEEALQAIIEILVFTHGSGEADISAIGFKEVVNLFMLTAFILALLFVVHLKLPEFRWVSFGEHALPCVEMVFLKRFPRRGLMGFAG